MIASQPSSVRAPRRCRRAPSTVTTSKVKSSIASRWSVISKTTSPDSTSPEPDAEAGAALRRRRTPIAAAYIPRRRRT